jgi:hypothetical protein
LKFPIDSKNEGWAIAPTAIFRASFSRYASTVSERNLNRYYPKFVFDSPIENTQYARADDESAASSPRPRGEEAPPKLGR